jgi:hypothetical protein
VTAYIFTRIRDGFACMTRLARMVIPGLPHHVTQRGNRREAIFFGVLWTDRTWHFHRSFLAS